MGSTKVPESTDYEHDAFISYCEADREWVERELLPRLKRAGIEYIEEHNLPPGPRPEVIEQAIEESRWTLLIVSPEYLAEPSMDLERLLSFHRSIRTRNWRVITVVVKHCKLPPHLDMLTLIRVNVGEDWWPRLKSNLCGKERSTHPATTPGPGPGPPPPVPPGATREDKIRWNQRDDELLRRYFLDCRDVHDKDSNKPWERRKWEEFDSLATLNNMDDVTDYLQKSMLLEHDERGWYFTREGALLFCKRLPLRMHTGVVASTLLPGGERSSWHIKRQSIYRNYHDIREWLKEQLLIIGRRYPDTKIADGQVNELGFVLEEAAANFVIHRDYSIADDGYIVITRDYIEFTNPGTGEYTEEELLRELKEKDRDLLPRYGYDRWIVEAFNDTKVCQKSGSGLRAMWNSLNEWGVFGPDVNTPGMEIKIDEEKRRFKLRLYWPRTPPPSPLLPSLKELVLGILSRPLHAAVTLLVILVLLILGSAALSGAVRLVTAPGSKIEFDVWPADEGGIQCDDNGTWHAILSIEAAPGQDTTGVVYYWNDEKITPYPGSTTFVARANQGEPIKGSVRAFTGSKAVGEKHVFIPFFDCQSLEGGR